MHQYHATAASATRSLATSFWQQPWWQVSSRPTERRWWCRSLGWIAYRCGWLDCFVLGWQAEVLGCQLCLVVSARHT
jgi:hypothetical protein